MAENVKQFSESNYEHVPAVGTLAYLKYISDLEIGADSPLSDVDTFLSHTDFSHSIGLFIRNHQTHRPMRMQQWLELDSRLMAGDPGLPIVSAALDLNPNLPTHARLSIYGQTKTEDEEVMNYQLSIPIFYNRYYPYDSSRPVTASIRKTTGEHLVYNESADRHDPTYAAEHDPANFFTVVQQATSDLLKVFGQYDETERIEYPTIPYPFNPQGIEPYRDDPDEFVTAA